MLNPGRGSIDPKRCMPNVRPRHPGTVVNSDASLHHNAGRNAGEGVGRRGTPGLATSSPGETWMHPSCGTPSRVEVRTTLDDPGCLAHHTGINLQHPASYGHRIPYAMGQRRDLWRSLYCTAHPEPHRQKTRQFSGSQSTPAAKHGGSGKSSGEACTPRPFRFHIVRKPGIPLDRRGIGLPTGRRGRGVSGKTCTVQPYQYPTAT